MYGISFAVRFLYSLFYLENEYISIIPWVDHDTIILIPTCFQPYQLLVQSVVLTLVVFVLHCFVLHYIVNLTGNVLCVKYKV